jgi:hypothetical protein
MGQAGVDVVNIANPANPVLVGIYDTDVVDLSANAVLTSPSGDYLYIADDIWGVKIVKITSPTNLDPTNCLNAAGCDFNTGFTGTAMGLALDPAGSSFLHVAAGDAGLEVAYVSSKVNPTALLYPPVTGSAVSVLLPGTANAVVVGPNDSFVACGSGGVQVVGMSTWTNKSSYPSSGDVVGVTYSNNTLYAACANAGIMLLDMSNPAKPSRFGGYVTADIANALTLVGTNIYVASGGLEVFVTNFPANPPRLGNYFDTTNGSTIRAVTVISNMVFGADSGLGMTVINVASNASPKWVTNFIVAGFPSGITSYGDTNVFVTVGTSGLEIEDVSDPTNPVTTGVVDTPGDAQDVAVDTNGAYAYVADGFTGVMVVDITDVALPHIVATNKLPTNYPGAFANSVVLRGDFAYVAGGGAGLVVVDIGDPLHPLNIGTVANATNNSANSVALKDNYAFVADGGRGLSVIDITDPFHPSKVASLTVGDVANYIAISGNYAYMANGGSSLDVIDITNPRQPRRVGGNTAFDAVQLTIYSNKVYVAEGNRGFDILSLFKPIAFSNYIPVITNTRHLFLTGPTNQPIRVQRSTNVANTNGWVDWQSVTFVNNNPIELVDTNIAANPRRFYRAISP